MLAREEWSIPKVEAESDVVSVLRAAKQIISDPSRWTCGEYARTSRGNCVGVETAAAVSFCSVGALALACGLSIRCTEDSPAYGHLRAAAAEQNYIDVHLLNDGGGHDAAMAMFDRAIDLAAAVA